MKKRCGDDGFTIVELLIIVVIIAVLAAMGVVGYNGIQKRVVVAVLESDLSNAEKAVELEAVDASQPLDDIPATFHASQGVTLTYISLGRSHYSNLNTVQNGVLFHTLCDELANDPQYATIHAKDGSASDSVVMTCDDSVDAHSLQITGWDTKKWSTPLTKETIEAYLASVPADAWWTDKQKVIRKFYTTLISRFSASGGTWPIQSFWDPWANEWNGTKKETLPVADNDDVEKYCIQASHQKFPEIMYHVTYRDKTAKEGSCE